MNKQHDLIEIAPIGPGEYRTNEKEHRFVVSGGEIGSLFKIIGDKSENFTVFCHPDCEILIHTEDGIKSTKRIDSTESSDYISIAKVSENLFTIDECIGRFIIN